MNISYLPTVIKNSRMMLLLAFSLFVQCAFAQDYYTAVNDDVSLRRVCKVDTAKAIWDITKQDTLLAIGSPQTIGSRIWLPLQMRNGVKGFAVKQSDKGVYLKKVVVAPPPPPPIEEMIQMICNGVVKVQLPQNAGSSLKICLNSHNIVQNRIIDYVMKDILFVRDLTGEIPYSLTSCDKIGNNCIAVSQKDKAYIVINETFIKTVLSEFGEFAVYYILAHEIAHHNKFHMSNKGIGIKAEQEADFSAGSMLKRLGATVEDMETIHKFLNQYNISSETHGTATSRMAYIKNGWQQTPKWANKPPVAETVETGRLRDGFMWIKKNNRFGFVNHLGREIIPPIYMAVENFKDIKGIALTRVQNTHGVWLTIDKYGRQMN